MKAVRILLQLVILGVGGIALGVLISHPVAEIKSILVLLGFLAVLLGLTLALKEYTESRSVPVHGLSFKPMGTVLLLLGAFSVFHGASYLVGSQALPDGSGTCRAACGLILLTSQLLGETAARVLAFGLSSGTGLFLCYLGFKIRGVRMGDNKLLTNFTSRGREKERE